MGISYGFFDSIDRDRLYDATDISRFLDGLVGDGVFRNYGDGFTVYPVSTEVFEDPFRLALGTGKAWLTHIWVENDAPYEMSTPISDVPQDKYRFDRVYLYIDTGSRTAGFSYVKGEEYSDSSWVGDVTELLPIVADTDTRKYYLLSIVTFTNTDGYYEHTPSGGYIWHRLDSKRPMLYEITSTIGYYNATPIAENLLNNSSSKVDTFAHINNEWKQYLQGKQEQAYSSLDALESSKVAEANGLINGLEAVFNNWFNSVKSTLAAQDPAVDLVTQINGVKDNYIPKAMITQENVDDATKIPSSKVLYDTARAYDDPTRVYPTWAYGSDQDILDALTQAYLGTVDLEEDYGWAIGDERVIQLSAMDYTVPRSSDQSKETTYHGDAQTVTLVLMDKGVYDLADGSGKCKFVVGLKELLNMHPYTIYPWLFDPSKIPFEWDDVSNAYREFLAASLETRFPAYLRTLFKEFKAPYMPRSWGDKKKIMYTTEKLTVPSYIEVFGSNTLQNMSSSFCPEEIYNTYVHGSDYLNGSDYFKQLEYYKIAANRYKVVPQDNNIPYLLRSTDIGSDNNHISLSAIIPEEGETLRYTTSYTAFSSYYNSYDVWSSPIAVI